MVRGRHSERESLTRNRQVRWLRELRERTQYSSLALRPQSARQLWMKEK